MKVPLITSRLMGAVVVLFLLVDGVAKLILLGPVLEGTVSLGYPAALVRAIGLLEVACLGLYVLPRTRVLGALLLTGYLGGAVATHVRIGSPLATHVLFPIYVATLLWGALWLTEDRVRALLPVRRVAAG